MKRICASATSRSILRFGDTDAGSLAWIAFAESAAVTVFVGDDEQAKVSDMPGHLSYPATITLDNRDDVGTFGQHNLAVYEDDSYAAQIAATSPIRSPSTASGKTTACSRYSGGYRSFILPRWAH